VRVLIYKDGNGEWRWRTKRKGRVTGDSGEGYANKANAQRAWEAFSKAVFEHTDRFAHTTLKYEYE
jgi:uncharacterized protein YegP (UPF0339 family)